MPTASSSLRLKGSENPSPEMRNTSDVVDAMPANEMNAQTEHSKKRVSKACDCCRKSKTKCDGQRPCSRCLQDGKICTYMTKKKADQMYPASYVDLLETRVSILVQSLTQLLNRSRVSDEELHDFCCDRSLLNEDGEFDINKVICRLMPSENLENLAESSQDYSLDEITHVSNAEGRSPSPKEHSHHHSSHSSLSRARRASENHNVHKIPIRKSEHTPASSSSISMQSRLSMSATSPSSESPISVSSLDIFKQPQRASTLDSILFKDEPLEQLDFDYVNFSDSMLVSPVYSMDELESSDYDQLFKPIKQELTWQPFSHCSS